MALAALIAAYHEADEAGGGLRATLPLAGRTLVERQARLAASAGAAPIVIAVERVPPGLTAAIDRMRAEGLDLVVARTAAEAAEAVEPEDGLLLMADGVLAAQSHLDQLSAIGGPSILTVPDVRVDDRYERIDAHSRWAGLALLDGALLGKTAEMLGDWDLQSTLLRRAVQSGARQISLRGEPADEQLVVAERSEDLEALQARLLEGVGVPRRDWVSRYLFGPVEQAATRAVMPTRLTPSLLQLGAVLLTAFAAIFFASEWYGVGMALLLLATPLDGIAERLAALRLQDGVERSWWAHLLPIVAAGALLALGITLSPERGWGCLSLAAATVAFVVALRIEMHGREIPGSVWLAERKGLTWLLLPFASTGLWGTGLTFLALYAAGSFFWAQRHAHAAPARPLQD